MTCSNHAAADHVETVARLSAPRVVNCWAFRLLLLVLGLVPPLREQLNGWHVEWKSEQYIEPLLSPSPTMDGLGRNDRAPAPAQIAQIRNSGARVIAPRLGRSAVHRGEVRCRKVVTGIGPDS